MRYQDVRRLSGVEGAWLRLKLWLRPVLSPQAAPLIDNLSHLSDHDRRDIGIPDPVRYLDWRSLRDRGSIY
ncbi:hypothetical protein [Microvirga sp. 17 mud 1-3]|uniref:hypothetical protein n=1 Tax=Microvirga sp. 17 mud 1-3 TaxID=2082949 RepID=UPI0013A5533D|nr:hypothetical protein [Microvirga sp. 17 mud 1-3]